MSEKFGFDNMHYRSGFEAGVEATEQRAIAEGERRAEERIIKLLTPDLLRRLVSDNEWSATGDHGVDYEGFSQDLSSLIKGEQK